MPTKIEWTDETWTPLRARNRETGKVGHFCVHHSPGCKFCYAEILQKRFQNPVRYAAQDADKVELFLDDKVLTAPLRWRRPRMVFVCSMTDLFYEGYSDDLIDQVFAVMAAAPQHTFQVLTKRAERLMGYHDMPYARRSIIAEWAGKLCEDGDRVHDAVLTGPWPLPNVWLGVSGEDQQRAVERIPHLLDTPAAVRFLSVEPLLGPVDLTRIEIVPDSHDEDRELRRAGIRIDALRNKHVESGMGRGLGPINWVIVGGESGPRARPMHPDWVRAIRDQCQVAGVPFFFKQWGEWDWLEHQNYADAEVIANHRRAAYEHHSCGRTAIKVGKKRAGRELDGRTWNEMPA